jgi:hypothetical protein
MWIQNDGYVLIRIMINKKQNDDGDCAELGWSRNKKIMWWEQNDYDMEV